MAKLQPDYISWVLKLNAKEANKEITDLEKANKSLKASTKELKSEMMKLTMSGEAGSDKWHNLNKELEASKKIMAENNAKIDECTKRLDLTTMSANQLNKKAKELRGQMNNLSQSLHPKEYAELKKELDRVTVAQNKLAQEGKGLLSTFLNFSKFKSLIAGVFAGIGMMITGKIVGTFRDAITTIIAFEKANSVLAAVIGKTKNEIKALTQQARDLGATTRYTASEVTALQIELAKLGFKEDFILKMTAPILKFASAVNTELAPAAALTGATLRIFGLRAEDTTRVVSTMAIGCNNSALSFEYLNNAMATVGPVASTFGFSVEETTALLGALSDKGFDASSAATATRNILLNLADSNGTLALALGKPVKNLDDLVVGLKKLKAEGIDLATTLELTDKRSVSAFNAFIDSSSSILNLRDSITDSEEKFYAMSAEMSDNVQGSLAILTSTLEGLVLRFYESRGALKLFIDGITALLEGIGWVIDKIGEFNSVTGFLINSFLLYNSTLLISSIRNLKFVQTIIASITAENSFIVAVKSSAFFLNAKNIVMALVNITTALLTRNTAGLTVAFASLGTAIKAIPWMAIISVVLSLGLALAQSSKKTEELTETKKALQKADQNVAETLAVEKRRIEELIDVMNDEKQSKEAQIKAMNMLNTIIPDYNAHLDSTTGKYVANKKAIDDYLKSLEKKIRVESIKDEYIRHMGEEEKVKIAIYKHPRNRAEFMNKHIISGEPGEHGIPKDLIADARKAFEKKSKELNAELTYAEKETKLFNDYLKQNKLTVADLITPNTPIQTEIEKKSKIKELEGERKRVSANWKEDTEENIALKNKEIERIDVEIARLNELGKTKKGVNGKNNGEYKDNEVKAVTNPLDNAHKENMGNIKKSRASGTKTEAEYALEETDELLRHHKDRIAKLHDLEKNTPTEKKKILDEIHAQITTSQNEITNSEIKAEETRITILKDAKAKRINVESGFYNTQISAMETALLKREITQEQHDAHILTVNKGHTEQLLSIENDYSVQLSNLEINNENNRIELKKESNDKIKELRMQELRDAVAVTDLIRKATEDGVGSEGMTQKHERDIAETNAKYDTLTTIARAAGLDVTALEEQRKQALLQLEFDFQNSVYQIQQQLGVSWQEEFDKELSMLKNQLDKKLITEDEFEEKKNAMKMNRAKKYFDLYNGLSSNMVEALQQAEIDMNNAKYDVLIEGAKGNSEQQEALEQEKAEKQLEIQKKYADVNFAIKASQIIADTAVSIMKATADLGPIAGGIAGVLLGVTGLAQLASANAERQKIKNMRLNNSSKSSDAASAPSAKRVVSGYSEGGYTGNGQRYDVAGLVHRGEYVVPMPEMRNPLVIDAVAMIEAIRTQRTRGISATSSQGYADGGYTGTNEVSSSFSDIGALMSVISELRATCEALKLIRAYVVYQDFEKAQKNLDNARNVFTRNK